MKNEIMQMLTNAQIGSQVKIGNYYFTIERNETGCFRAVSDIKVTHEDKAFFSSRNTALDAYTAALTVQDYNVNIVNNIQKIRYELLVFIMNKKSEYNIPDDVLLDFDGNVYFIQISHGPGCKSH